MRRHLLVLMVMGAFLCGPLWARADEKPGIPSAPSDHSPVQPGDSPASQPTSSTASPQRPGSGKGKWFYAVENTRLGPVTEEQLRGLFAAGRANARTLVWRDGMDDWTPLYKIPELSGLLSAGASGPCAHLHGGLLGRAAADELAGLPPLELPQLSPDTLAFGQSFSVGLSALNLDINNQQSSVAPSAPKTGDDSLDFRANIAGSYYRYHERERFAYQALGGLSLRPDVSHNFSSDQTNAGVNLHPYMAGEARFYVSPRAKFMLFGGAQLDYSMHYSKSNSGDWISHYFQFVPHVGAGFGRVLNIAPAEKLRKIEKQLMARGIISGAIPRDVGRKILLHWYALRNEVGYYKHVAYTIKVLQQAALLKKRVSHEAFYIMAQIIRDSQMATRYQGWLVSALIYNDLTQSESTLFSETTASMGSAVVGDFSKVINAVTEFTLDGMINIDWGVIDSANPWLLFSIRPRFRRYFYSKFMDPLGALSVGGKVQLGAMLSGSNSTLADIDHYYDFYGGVTDMNLGGNEVSLDAGANVSYQYFFTRGTSLSASLAAGVTHDPNVEVGYYVILSFGYVFGLSQGYFSAY